MTYLNEIVEFESGTSQFRVVEISNDEAPQYAVYGQVEMDDDLNGAETPSCERKYFRTYDRTKTLQSGDVIFNLISKKATVVGAVHNGDSFSQNYVKLIPSNLIDARYLAFLLNENDEIQRQWFYSQQGSAVIKKCTIRQLSKLEIPQLPPIGRQKVIGELYFNQLKLVALKKHQATLETTLMLEKLKEASQL